MVMNENHHPPLPEIQRVIQDGASLVNRYPDMFGGELARAIGEMLGVPSSNVVVGPGSATLCLQLLNAFAGADDEVVHAWPSFEGYPLLIQNCGATAVSVALRDDIHDLSGMAERITDRTRIVLLCNPNNPTGTVLPADELDRFVADLPDGVLVVIDEAYRDFARPDATANGVDLFRRYPDRVCVLRTFSKSYGLAGLRVGYLVAGEVVAGKMAMLIPFLSVNSLGQAAALAGIAARHSLLDRCASIGRQRDELRAALVDAGWRVPRSDANFLWLATESASGFAGFCAENGVLIRPFDRLGVRVTVSEPEANDFFLQLATKYQEDG
jgi:histidinol-phosphate aminotransferase